jgi:hypothetical protein
VLLEFVSVEHELAHNDCDKANDDQKWQQQFAHDFIWLWHVALSFSVPMRPKPLGLFECLILTVHDEGIRTIEYAHSEFVPSTLCTLCHTYTGTSTGCIACRFLLGTQLAKVVSVVSPLVALALFFFRGEYLSLCHPRFKQLPAIPLLTDPNTQIRIPLDLVSSLSVIAEPLCKLNSVDL